MSEIDKIMEQQKALSHIEHIIPATVTVSCPIKQFQQRYVKVGCMNCDFYAGIAMLTDATEMPIRERVTGKEIGLRPIHWHEKYMVRCAYPMTRRCTNISIVED